MRKFIWIGAIVVFIAGVLFLNISNSGALMTSKAGSVTTSDFLKQVTTTSGGQDSYMQLVISKVLGAEYKNTVTDAKINDEIKKLKDQYGSNFQTYLSSTGQTEDTLRTSIKESLVMIEAVKQNHTFSQDELQKAYDEYTPSMNVSIITVDSEDTANGLIEKLNNGDKFSTLAKKYSIDTITAKNGGKMESFDSTSTTVDSAIVDAAVGLEVGKYTDSPVQTNSGYSIIMLRSKDDKKSLNSYKNILLNQLSTEWMNDSNNTTAMQKIVGKILKKYDTVPKGNYPGLTTAIDNYIISATNSSSSSKK